MIIIKKHHHQKNKTWCGTLFSHDFLLPCSLTEEICSSCFSINAFIMKLCFAYYGAIVCFMFISYKFFRLGSIFSIFNANLYQQTLYQICISGNIFSWFSGFNVEIELRNGLLWMVWEHPSGWSWKHATGLPNGPLYPQVRFLEWNPI